MKTLMTVGAMVGALVLLPLGIGRLALWAVGWSWAGWAVPVVGAGLICALVADKLEGWAAC